MRITVAPANTGPAGISRFRISNLSGATYRNGSPPAEAQVLVFDLNPLGLLATGSFRLGMDVVLAGGTSSGTFGIAYTVTIELI